MLNELHIIIAFFASGVLIGLLFDVFRITRKAFKTPNILTYIEDVLFWMLSGILLIFVISVFTYGEVRMYMIVMLISGALIYFYSISKFFIKINTSIIIYCKNLVTFVFKAIYNIFKFWVRPFKYIKKFAYLKKK